MHKNHWQYDEYTVKSVFVYIRFLQCEPLKASAHGAEKVCLYTAVPTTWVPGTWGET